MFEGNGLLPLIARLKAEFITRAERFYAGSFWGARTVTASTTATLSDVVFLANTAAGNITVTLPLASSATGKVYTLKKTSSDANTATFARAGSDTIDGATSVGLTGYMQSVMIVSDGTGWFVPASFSRDVTLPAKSANTVLAGPASGAAAAPAFRALTVSDLPQTWQLTRVLAGGAIGNYTEIGNFDVANGAHAIRVTCVENDNGAVFAKTFDLASVYNQTGGAWKIVKSISNTGYYGYDWHLIAMQSGTALNLRLVVLRNNNAASLNIDVRIENTGKTADVFTSTSATGSMSVPTQIVSSGLDWHAVGGVYQLWRAIPSSNGGYVEMFSLTGTNGGVVFDLIAENSDNGYVVSKRYVYTGAYNITGNWSYLAPVSSSGAYGSRDWHVVVQQNGPTATLRLLRTDNGGGNGTVQFTLAFYGGYEAYFNELSGTGTMSVPSIYHASGLLTQVGYRVGIGAIGPSGTLDVQGAVDEPKLIVRAANTGNQSTDIVQIKDSSANNLVVVNRYGKMACMASNANAASLNVAASSTDPSAPAVGDVWHDAQNALSAFLAGIRQRLLGVLFTQTASATVANTTVQTTLFAAGIGTVTLPANFWKVGKSVRLELRGYYSTDGTGSTLNFAFKHGAVALGSVTTTLHANALNQHWALRMVITCRSVGASGTIHAQGDVARGAVNTLGIVNAAVITVDTTASAALNALITFGTAAAANTITCTNATVEVLN